MKLFDIDFIDQLSEEEVRYLLRSEMERNKLLVKQNKFLLFRYEVENDLMVILGQAPDGTIFHEGFERYSKEPQEAYFDKQEHVRIIQALMNIIHNPDYPKTGAETFHFLDGTVTSCEYSCLYNKDGKVDTIMGQHVNIFQTHERMLSTIEMLNHQVALNDVIRQSYETMISINLSDYSFEVLQGTPEVRFAAQKCSSVMDLGKLFCQYYVESNYQHGFLDFIDNITINDRLTNNRFLAFEYQTHNIGWCRARIVPGEMDSHGDVINAIFTTERSVNQSEELSVLRIAATTDALTGLMNRYSGDIAFKEILERQEAYIVLLFDCDHFKLINDKLGHPVGDRVLIEVAHSLKEVFPAETVIRLGGDEFFVIITSRQLIGQAVFEGVASVLAPLYARLKQIKIAALQGFSTTLSCGAVIVSPGKIHTLSEVYELVDKKLYEAKTSHNGRLVTTEI